VLKCFCEIADWPGKEPFFLTLAGVIGAILEQESIACATDGRMQMGGPAKLTEGCTRREILSDLFEQVLTELALEHFQLKSKYFSLAREAFNATAGASLPSAIAFHLSLTSFRRPFSVSLRPSASKVTRMGSE
jgi:hypothetical protein